MNRKDLKVADFKKKLSAELKKIGIKIHKTDFFDISQKIHRHFKDVAIRPHPEESVGYKRRVYIWPIDSDFIYMYEPERHREHLTPVKNDAKIGLHRAIKLDNLICLYEVIGEKLILMQELNKQTKLKV